MARANYVKAAAKDYPDHGIKKGEPYYWWKFRHGGKHYSKTPPKQSQLTQSAYLSQAYEIEERVGDLTADSSLKDDVESLIEDLNNLADECEGNKSNMPDSLQESDTGQLLEERAQACRDAAESLEQVDLDDFEPDEDETAKLRAENEDPDADEVNIEGQTEDDYWSAKLEEVQNNFSFDIQ